MTQTQVVTTVEVPQEHWEHFESVMDLWHIAIQLVCARDTWTYDLLTELDNGQRWAVEVLEDRGIITHITH